ncbi:hypothetical protein CR194_12720 [Salipaludibacillus keqinensis]|uniref:Uncharacterized protein n=2 Tax=Salipaludibacillus keqinensis TaxID=2045207 RepID=A0A323TG39_9BACI|nr:hypothetical protein CR194_12720 [Salipaludibacillus keqinensis]
MLHYVKNQLAESEPLLMKKDRNKLARKAEQENLEKQKKIDNELKEVTKLYVDLKGETQKIKRELLMKDDVLRSKNK